MNEWRGWGKCGWLYGTRGSYILLSLVKLIYEERTVNKKFSSRCAAVLKLNSPTRHRMMNDWNLLSDWVIYVYNWVTLKNRKISQIIMRRMCVTNEIGIRMVAVWDWWGTRIRFAPVEDGSGECSIYIMNLITSSLSLWSRAVEAWNWNLAIINGNLRSRLMD